MERICTNFPVLVIYRLLQNRLMLKKFNFEEAGSLKPVTEVNLALLLKGGPSSLFSPLFPTTSLAPAPVF